MKQLLLIILSIIAFTSCEESRKDEIARLVKEWEGKEIHFPEHPVFTIQGKDTVDFSFREITDKFVTWVENKLNNRPRKRLGYLTPNEKFNSIPQFGIK